MWSIVSQQYKGAVSLCQSSSCVVCRHADCKQQGICNRARCARLRKLHCSWLWSGCCLTARIDHVWPLVPCPRQPPGLNAAAGVC
jgi:hypothetical protein